MAGGYRNPDWPVKCFNGHKNWVLGWYKSRQLKLDPAKDGLKFIPLAAFVDYRKTQGQEPVLINISNRFYLQYNRAKGFNRETEEKRNQLTVTEATDSGSESRAGLGFGDRYESKNFDGKGGTLMIEVCDIVMGDESRADVILVSIGMDRVLCAKERNPRYAQRPTSEPVAPPTAVPTLPPTVKPTTSKPTTANPTTLRPTIPKPTTMAPTTTEFTTAEPTITPQASTEPTTSAPLTSEPSVRPTNCGSVGVLCMSLEKTLVPTFNSTTLEADPKEEDCVAGSGVLCAEKAATRTIVLPRSSDIDQLEVNTRIIILPRSSDVNQPEANSECDGVVGAKCDENATTLETSMPTRVRESATVAPSRSENDACGDLLGAPCDTNHDAATLSPTSDGSELEFNQTSSPASDSLSYQLPTAAPSSPTNSTVGDCDGNRTLCTSRSQSLPKSAHEKSPARPATPPWLKSPRKYEDTDDKSSIGRPSPKNNPSAQTSIRPWLWPRDRKNGGGSWDAVVGDIAPPEMNEIIARSAAPRRIKVPRKNGGNAASPATTGSSVKNAQGCGKDFVLCVVSEATDNATSSNESEKKLADTSPVSGKMLDGPQPPLPPSSLRLDRVFVSRDHQHDYVIDQIGGETGSNGSSVDASSALTGTSANRESVSYLRLGPDRGGVAFEGIFGESGKSSSIVEDAADKSFSLPLPSSPPGFVDLRTLVTGALAGNVAGRLIP